MKRPVLGSELVILASCLLFYKAEQLNAKTPLVLGEGFYTGESTPTQQQAAGNPGVATESAATSAAGPVCTDDAACQQLCPTADFTKAAPPLPLSTVQHQVHQPAMALVQARPLATATILQVSAALVLVHREVVDDRSWSNVPMPCARRPVPLRPTSAASATMQTSGQRPHPRPARPLLQTPLSGEPAGPSKGLGISTVSCDLIY